MSEITPKGKIITGYKATNQNRECNSHKFEIGKWYEHEGELSLCESGFHFCPHMSGVWAYYPEESRVFEVEAECVLIDYRPGADLKYVCRRIRLVREVKIGGDGNTGNGNTGYGNTGKGNTTDYSTGYFCQNKQRVICFDKQTTLTHEQFEKTHGPLACELGRELAQDKPFDYERYNTIPNWTLRKIKSLHRKHINGRQGETT